MGRIDDKPLQLQLLGAFEVRADGRVIIDSAWPNRRAATLLKLLAINGGSLHRDQIYEALWPQSEPVAAAGSLRRCLYQLRAALNGDASQPVLLSEPDRVVLDGAVEVDVEVFLRLAREARAARTDAARYDEALATYTGDLLPGDLYEDYCEPLRSELREQRNRLLMEAALLHESEGRSHEAEEYLRRLIAIDSAHEAAHCALMRVYAAGGQRDQALRQYQRCVEALSRELDAKPSEQTEALYRQIKGTDQPLPATESLQIPAEEAKIIPFRPSLSEEQRTLPVSSEDELVGQPGARPEPEVRGLRRLLENRAVRVAAAVLVLGVIGAGVAGGMFAGGAVGGGGSPAGAEYRELNFHIAAWQPAFRLVSGDCQSSDLIFRSGGEEDPVAVTGEFPGQATFGVSEVTFYPIDSCQWGLNKGTFTLTDGSGNTLSVAYQNTINLVGFLGEGPRAELSPTANIITGGTGVYQGARGQGRCNVKGIVVPAMGEQYVTDVPGIDPVGNAVIEADCTFQVTPGGAAASGAQPVILELGAGASRLTVFGSPVDLPQKVYFNVIYFNPRDQAQTGLSLRLRAPEGAEVSVAARGEEETTPAGEWVWALPDLAPGALGSVEFSVQFLSADTETVDLVAEIEGDGFEEPVRSDPLAIEVVQ